MPKQNKASRGSLRIIGGQWRGRKLDIVDLEGLRPTANRIRETLFNWLQTDIGLSHCLDLYAGTGALGLEAASRGAKQVTLLEVNQQAAKQLQTHCDALDAGQCQVINTTAMGFLAQNKQQYDIVFIDPPYQDNAWSEVAQQLMSTQALADQALIYIEYPTAMDTPELPQQWQLLKEKKAGAVQYALYQHTKDI